MLALSAHAERRQQQRAVSNTTIDWLTKYGRSRHDGHGCVIRFFDHKSREKLRSQVLRAELVRCENQLNAYIVVREADGAVVTVGRRTQRINR